MEGVSTSPLSRSLYNKSPDKYGGKQSDYEKRAMEAVMGGLTELEEAVTSEKELTGVFRKIQAGFSEKRSKIASDHDTRDAHFFGKCRILPQEKNIETGVPVNAFTALRRPYENSNDQLLKRLLAYLNGVGFTTKQCNKGPAVFTSESENGLSELKVEVLSQQDFLARNKTFDLEEYRKVAGPDITMEMLGHDSKVHEKVHKEALWLYEGTSQYILHRDIDYHSFACKTHYVKTTISQTINGELVPLGGHLTWFDNSWEEDGSGSLASFFSESVAYVLHQDPFYIDKTLGEVDKVFQKCVDWKESDGIKVLKDHVSRFRFLYAFAMPNIRGDGAIGDWLELMIYQYHGFTDTAYSSEKLPCFEPLTSLSYEQYRKVYDQTITVQ